MIKFPCPCGFMFSVPQDLAGTDLQCPECKRLIDVPLLGELHAVGEDGTYHLDTRPTTDPATLPKLLYNFNRNTLDQAGNEKDLRISREEIVKADSNDLPQIGHPLKQAPRYDPETGELIRPLEIIHRYDEIPFAKALQKPTLTYATRDQMVNPPWGIVFLKVLAIPDVIVLIFIVAFHLMTQVVSILLAMILPLLPFAVLILVIIGHYGNILVHVGCEEKDDLPRPLGDFELYNDMWRPFYRTCLAIALSYGPYFYIVPRLEPSHYGNFWAGVLFMWGSILFPMLQLTVQASDSIINLAPHKVLRAIRTMGLQYVVLVSEWIVAALLYYHYITLGLYRSQLLIFNLPKLGLILNMALLIGSVYTTHVFHWHLGIAYRTYSHLFPWQFFDNHTMRHRVDRNAHAAIMRAKKTAAAPSLKKTNPCFVLIQIIFNCSFGADMFRMLT